MAYETPKQANTHGTIIEDYRYVLSSARCLLWCANVEQQDGNFHWQLDPIDLNAAQRFLPLEVRPGESYAMAWFRAKHPEDTPRIKQNAETAMREGKLQYNQEFRCADKTGKLRWLYEDVYVKWLAENRWRLVGVCTDISNQKQIEEALRASEEKYRTLFEKSQDAIYITTRTGILVNMNPSTLELFGFRREEMLGLNVSDLYVYPEERVRFQKEIEKTGSLRDYEVKLHKKDGIVMDCLLTSTVRWDARGRAVGYEGIIRDITEHRRLEREVLEICENEQRRTGRDLHDSLGQHLTGVALLATDLARRLAEQGQTDEVRVAEEITDLLTDAVRQTRQLASGLIPVALERDGLVTALKNLANTVKQQSGIKCDFDADEDKRLPLTIHDLSLETHLYRIAQEAVNNAVRHSEAEQIVIGLTTVNGSITLLVKDDGVGMPESPDENRGMGIRLMRYRANAIGAELEILPGDGGGTIVRCVVDAEK
jgi:two-component system, LuxR family, sensor kinase FixL